MPRLFVCWTLAAVLIILGGGQLEYLPGLRDQGTSVSLLPLCPCVHKLVIDKHNIPAGLITLFWLLGEKKYVASVKRMLLRKLVQTSYMFGRLLGQNITRHVGKGAEHRSLSRDS